VKGTPSPPPPPLLRKSCPQDVVNVFLVETLSSSAPQQVVLHTLQIRLGPLAILFSVGQVFDEVLPDGALDRFNFLVELTDGPNLSLGVVLFSVVLPCLVIGPVVVREGKCDHHGLKFHWSRITGVSGSSSITSVSSLIVVNQLALFDCSASLVLIASLSA
jgi:hypothetical protein